MDPLKDILRNHLLIIPTNQRAYSWRKEHAKALIDDLKLMGNNSHYLGPLIVTPSGRDNFRDTETRDYIKEYIVDDGQQRLTTCLLFIDALVKRFDALGEENHQHAVELKSFLTFSFEGEHLRIRNENADLDQFLNHIVLAQPAPATRTSAMKCLEEVADYFSHFLSGTTLNDIIDWKLCLTSQAKFILVDLGTEDIDRYLAFDAINSRGLPLTEFDKIKNFCALLSQRRTSLLINPETSWYNSLVALERFNVSTRLHESTYIADAYSIFFNKKTGPDDVHEQFVEEFRDLLYEDDHDMETRLSAFVGFWEQFAEAYGFVTSPQRDTVDAARATDEARKWLRNIDHLGYPGICRPLLCSSLMTCSPGDFEKVARWSEIYTFRVHAIAGKRTDNNKVGINELAHSAFREQISTRRISEILCFWLNQYCSIRELLKKLSDGEPKYHYDRLLKGWEHCYYFLYQFELHVSPITATPVPWQKTREQRRATIEHILPQSHRDGDYWETHWPDALEGDQFRHRLGNLVLTDGNSNLGNKPFPLKLQNPEASYSYNHNSSTNSEKQIRNYTDGQTWQQDEILRREAAMVRFASERWSFGCACDNSVFEFPGEFTTAIGEAEREIEIAVTDCIASADPQENALVDEILAADAEADEETNEDVDDPDENTDNPQI